MNIDMMASEEFLKKANDDLSEYCSALKIFREKPTVKRPLNKAIKKIQSIKGNASFAELHHIELLAQSNIEILNIILDKKIDYSEEVFKTFVYLIKLLREQFTNIEKKGRERNKDYDKIIAKIKRLKNGEKKIGIRLNSQQISEILGEDYLEEPIITESAEKPEIKSTVEEPPENIIEPTQNDTDSDTESAEGSVIHFDLEENEDVDDTDNEKIDADSEQYQYLRYEDDKAIIALTKKILTAEITTLHQEILTASDHKENVEIHMQGIEKASTVLIQTLLGCKKDNKAGNITFIDIPDHIIQQSEMLDITLS